MILLITGASGAGTTTLGEALAQDLGWGFIDSDAFFWLPTTPPFLEPRDEESRLAMMLTEVALHTHVVISGSIMDWGDALESKVDVIVFLYLDTTIRVDRVRKREMERYDKVNEDFVQWVGEYDSAPKEGRSLAKHQAWLSQQSCPVFRIEGDLSVDERIVRVKKALQAFPA